MIECVELIKTFGTHRALDRVSLSIRPGEFFTLLGPSGCGKTTLLRLIGGFEQPDSGSIRLDGDDITTRPPYRRPVNQVFQNYALFPHLSVEQNISFGLKMAGVPRAEQRQRVAEAIALVSLAGFEQRKPAQLSGGQKQRVALARAIINRPKMLLLDEPLAALDAQLRQSVQIELKQLQERLGITFVFVTHDQDEAMLLSNRLAVMNAGTILQIGSPREIYEQPATLAVAIFVGQANRLSMHACADDPRVIQTAGGLRLRCLKPAQQVATVIVRPQHVARCDSTAADFTANVTQIIFRGETVQYLLHCKTGEQWTARGWSPDNSVSIGTAVHCRVDPEALLTFDTAGNRIHFST